MTDTRWNGEPCTARRITAIVADATFPLYWARHLVGTRRNIVEVTYGGDTFYLDDEAGEGWNKVTHGGSPRWAHSNITIDPNSIQPREAADERRCARCSQLVTGNRVREWIGPASNGPGRTWHPDCHDAEQAAEEATEATDDTDERSTGQRWMDALLHHGPGYDITPAVPHFTARPVSAEEEAAATARAVQAAADSERVAEWIAKHSASDAVTDQLRQQLQQTETERDGAYRERAQLLGLLASLHPSVIAPAPDVDEPGWQILYLHVGARQASWHIAPRDAELLAHVEHVPIDDRRAQWDGHTTEEKYAHIGQHAARLYAQARGRVETPVKDAS